MIICRFCGYEIDDNSTKCPHCGNSCDESFECPSCGAKISLMDAVCPYCHSEITHKKSKNRFDDFIKALSESDNYGMRSFSHKINLIENFQVSNERSEILNFLYFASERITALVNESLGGYNWKLLKLWYSKAKTVVEKSKLVMPNDKTVADIFSHIQKNMKTAVIKKYFWVPLVIIGIAFFIIAGAVKGLSNHQNYSYTEVVYPSESEYRDDEYKYESEPETDDNTEVDSWTESVETTAEATEKTTEKTTEKDESTVETLKEIKEKAKEIFSSEKSTITKANAKNAFEDYGLEKYPNGFKCHWILKNYKSEPMKDGSWQFKVGVTVKDNDGKKQKLTAEGIVFGTNENPKIKDFRVY